MKPHTKKVFAQIKNAGLITAILIAVLLVFHNIHFMQSVYCFLASLIEVLICEAVFTQTYFFPVSFQLRIKFIIPSSSSCTLAQLSRLIRLLVSSANHLSTKFNHEECVGIKCSTIRPFEFSTYSKTSFVLCAA